MTDSLSSSFKDMVAPAGAQNGNQITITYNQISKAHFKRKGKELKLPSIEREFKKGEDEGYFKVNLATPGEIMQSVWKQPRIVTFTEKGMAVMAGLDGKEKFKEELEANFRIVPKWDPAAPDLPQKVQTVMRCIADLCTYWKKKYCFPALKTIQDRCREYYHTPMSLRTLSRCIDLLESFGWIRRQRRRFQRKDGTWASKTTLTEIASKFWEWAKRGASWLQKIFNFTDMPNMAWYPSTTKAKSKRIEGKGAKAAPSSWIRGGQLKLFDWKGLIASLDQ